MMFEDIYSELKIKSECCWTNKPLFFLKKSTAQYCKTGTRKK